MQAVPGLVELHQVRGERRVAEGVERTTHAQLLLPGPQAGGVEGVPGLPGAHRARGGSSTVARSVNSVMSEEANLI